MIYFIKRPSLSWRLSNLVFAYIQISDYRSWKERESFNFCIISLNSIIFPFLCVCLLITCNSFGAKCNDVLTSLRVSSAYHWVVELCFLTSLRVSSHITELWNCVSGELQGPWHRGDVPGLLPVHAAVTGGHPDLRCAGNMYCRHYSTPRREQGNPCLLFPCQQSI